MIKYLVADLGHSCGEWGNLVACKIKYDDLRKCLKNDAKNCKNLVFICNDADDFEANDERTQRLFEGLKMSGIALEKVECLDNRTKKNAKKIIQNADIIFLAGGKIECQLEFFERVKLKQLLKTFDGVLIGQSAGAMNMARKGYVYPEDESEFSNPKFFEGLELTDINIIPHFNRKTGNDYCPPSFHILDTYRQDSKNFGLNLLCVPNGSFVRIDDRCAEVFGEAYEVRGGRIYTMTEAEKKNYSPKKIFESLK